MIDTRLSQELNQFKKYCSKKKLGEFYVHAIDEFGFEVSKNETQSEEKHDLTFMAINHGDEVSGIAVLNQLCKKIDSGAIKPEISIVFLLGNVKAALQGKRYLERDMNRTFGYRSDSALESERVLALESIIKRSHFMVDLHQTIEPTHTPFFVFKYGYLAARFANKLHANYPVITHHKFTPSVMGGMRADEFASKSGCIAVSLELGQKGFTEASISTGLEVSIEAIEVVKNWTSICNQPVVKMNAMYTFQHIELYPEQYVELVPSLKNFEPVTSGQIIGETECKEKLTIPIDGFLLFPKYIKKGAVKPVEIYRILGKLDHLPDFNGGDANCKVTG